ncbi:MAG: putative lipid II flippase FtsW [Candidatus Nomurabacteria bacterium]|nr:MAG: putative lipid II flippase FtsW [Candidatus Nomurabacteria bacterium]
MRHQLRQADYALLITIVGLVLFGLIMLSSASSVISFQQYGDSNALLRRQIISAVLGLAGFFIIQRLDYHLWKKFAVLLLFLSIVFLIMVFVPGIGEEYLGARRWINLGVQFQPTELVKLAFLVYLASWLEKRREGFREPIYSFVPFMVILGIITLLVMAQPDLGTMTVIGLIAVIVYFVAGAPAKHFAWITAIAVSLFAIFIKIAPYRAARLTVFLNPALDPQGIGYHINQALLAIGTGGIFGVGLGHSRQKFNYLPEAAGDSIFAVIAEELGFLMVVALLAVFAFLIYRGFQTARQAPDDFGRLLAAGITAWLGLQAFVNIGALSGILPLTGIPLPFVSYGGTALVINLAAAGILLSISRQKKEVKSFRSL